MKKITLAAFGFLISIVSASMVSAAQYECIYTMNNNAACKGMKRVSYTCPFSDELNLIRMNEERTRKFTFPEFCSKTCAAQSGIPKECRNGSIRKVITTGADVSTPIVNKTQEVEVSTTVTPSARGIGGTIISIKTSLFGIFNTIKNIPSIMYAKIRTVLSPGINYNCQMPSLEGGCVPIPTATAGVRG